MSVEYGLFNDEGLVEGGFYSEDGTAALSAAAIKYGRKLAGIVDC